MKEQGNILVEDDYRDELEYIDENPPELLQTGASADLFNVSTLSPELKEFVESLLPEQQKVLHTLLAFEHPQAELEQIAEESMTMPQILLDDLNAVSMQTLGDLLVDFMDQEPYIMDEYVSPLKQSIA